MENIKLKYPKQFLNVITYLNYFL